MSFIVVIPARFASTRLPGKPLADLAGKPMIQRVYEQALQSQAQRVVIATDDDKIQSAAEKFGAEVVMTAVSHTSGTDRLEEVARLLKFKEQDIVVNVQGDEPLIPPAVIDQVANNLMRCTKAGIATLSEPIHSMEDVFNPNIVKVVSNAFNEALYFSRAPIPWARDSFTQQENSLPSNFVYQRHIGIYAYRVSFLKQFVSWTTSPLEITESLEQLRALWNQVTIHIEAAKELVPGGVDTPEDLARVKTKLLGL